MAENVKRAGHHRVHFYDAAAPMNVPSGVYVAAYVNGYAWTEAEIRRASHAIRISVHREAFWAKYARVIDVEPSAAEPGDVVPFLRERLAHGHHDGTAYVNRSNQEEVKQLVKQAGLSCRLWVATLDGTQTVDDMEWVWAVQYYGGNTAPYDLSILHGINDFGKV